MKVAIVTEYYYPDVGGTPEHVYHLSRSLIDRGHDVRVVAPDFGPEHPADPANVPVQRIGKSTLFMSNGSLSRATVGFGLGRKLAEYLNDERFDVIHVHSPLFPTLPMLAVKHAPERAVVIATLHTHFGLSRVLRSLRKLCQRYLNAIDGVIAVSESAARSALRYADFDYTIIPNGVDLTMWTSAEPLPELCDGKLNVSWLSRIEPRNELARMLRVFTSVNRRLGNIARLNVLGDGPGRDQQERSVPADQLGLIRFYGRVLAERPRFLRSTDVFCFPTNIVASPITLLEGMAAGCACIACDIDGVNQIVRHEREGVLVPIESDAALARALETLLTNGLLRQKYGAAARTRAEEYRWPHIASQVEAVYVEYGGRT
jgi:phosphatidylinositol alpha-mannosyltransferase